MKQKTLLITILLIANQMILAQSRTIIRTEKDYSTNLRLSYNSSIIYPGVRIGTETLLKRTELTKKSKLANTKLIFKDRLFTTNLGFYHHSNFHTNTYITAGYTFRRTKNKGFFTEFCPEIGYSRTFLSGTTYKVNDSGNASIKKMAGYNYALISVGLGLGYDFSKTKSKPFMVSYRVNLITMFPYNSFLYARPTMEIGLTYKPKKFLVCDAKIIKKI